MVVNKMIRPKKKFVCTQCSHELPKWEGKCRQCGTTDSYKEKILIPVKAKPQTTRSQKSLIRRAKNSERNIARRMLEVDGPDPVYRNVTSSTGRVGHITGMQVDAISSNYVIENKNRTMPVWINKAWVQILQRATDFGKHALLHIEPSNMEKEYVVNGMKKKTDTMAIITQTRHESLIVSEKKLFTVLDIIRSSDTNIAKVKQIENLLR